jgi:hypothetical protein
MGRPLRKDVFGTDAIGTYASASGVRVSFYNGSLRTDGVIIKQRGAKTFVVCRVADIGTGTSYATCVLQSTTPNALNEMQLIGYTSQGQAADNGPIPIAKITKRIATGFNGTRYKWSLQNDSSADYIALVAI